MIVVDHYSDFWEVDQLEETTSKDIIRKLMIHLSPRHTRHFLYRTMALSSLVRRLQHLLRNGRSNTLLAHHLTVDLMVKRNLQ